MMRRFTYRLDASRCTRRGAPLREGAPRALSRLPFSALLFALLAVAAPLPAGEPADSVEKGESGAERKDDAEAQEAKAERAEDAALLERVQEAIEAARATPGRESANALLDLAAADLARLRGETPAQPARLAAARRHVKHWLRLAEKGPAWPRPARVRIPRLSSPPRLDGRLDDPAWEGAAAFTGVYRYNDPAPRAAPATTWRIGWDAKALYVAFDCADDDIVAPELPRDAKVWGYDCVELFLLPEFAPGLYWEIVISPSGSVFDALQHKKFEGWGPLGQVDRDVAGLRFGIDVRGTPDAHDDRDEGYAVEMAVPWTSVPSYTRGNAPEAGDTLHFMLARLDKKSEDLDRFGKLEPYAFVPLLNWGHNIWNHAPAVLAPAASPAP